MASSIVQTVLAAQRVGATQQERALAVQAFDQLKTGEIRASAATGADLTQPSQPLEAQVMGYALLQHLVGNRWEDFTPPDSQQMTTLAYNLLRGSTQGATWVIRSKAALLLALIIKRRGADFLEASFKELVQLASQGPVVQEVVCMVIKYVADDIMQFPEEISGDARRPLLTSLKKTLSTVLTFLEQTLEGNFAAAQAPANNGGSPLAHAAAIQSALATASSYAEWAPLGSLKEAGLLGACGFLLGAPDFRVPACEVLRYIAPRKQIKNDADDDPTLFFAAQGQLVRDLSKAATAVLSPEALNELNYDGANDEFGQLLCETMATLGSMHLGLAAITPEERLLFLQQLLAFAQHPYLLLAEKALGVWGKLLQEAAAAALSNEKGRSSPTPLPPEAVLALMALAAEQLQQRGPHVPQEEEDIPEYFDTFEDYKELMIGYRAKLSIIIRSAAAVLPEQALHSANERLNAAVAAAGSHTTLRIEEKRVLLESAVVFMDSTVKAIWDILTPDQTAKIQAVSALCEPMLQAIMTLTVQDPVLALQQARGLEAFGRFLGVRPDLMPSVLSRIFDLLVTAIPLESDGRDAPPSSQPVQAGRDGFQSRQAYAAVVLSYARVAPEAFLPHLEPLAAKAAELRDSGRLRPGEVNTLFEALLTAAVAGPYNLQESVAEWILAPVRTAWLDPGFQASLTSPEAFMARFMPLNVPAGGGLPEIGGGTARWLFYYQLHMVERSIRAMSGLNPTQSTNNPLAVHMQWMLPPLLRLVTCVHSLYSPPGRALLGPVVSVLEISPQEKALYLKRSIPGKKGGASQRHSQPPSQPHNPAAASGAQQTDQGASENPTSGGEHDGEYHTVGGASIASLRAWIRHCREFALQAVGMLPTHCPQGLEGPEAASLATPSVFSFVDSLDHHQLRIVLRHVLIPYMKNCPVRFIPSWLIPMLAVLTTHMQTRLPAAWMSLAVHVSSSTDATGGDGSSNTFGFGSQFPAAEAATDEEILKDRLVRELTQEYADVLKELAARHMDDIRRLPSGSQAPPNSQKSKAAAAAAAAADASLPPGTPPKMLFEALLETEPAAGIAAATTAVDGMRCPDESAFRFSLFCRALVLLAPRDARLYGYVGTEVLRAAISSLASEVMVTHQADVLQLIRDVLAQQLGDPSSGVHAVLRSLPGVDEAKEAAFTAKFLGTGSEKVQRDAIKALLVEACGRSSFAALSAWKPSSVIPLTGTKARGARVAAAVGDQHATEQLQGEITRALFSG